MSNCIYLFSGRRSNRYGVPWHIVGYFDDDDDDDDDDDGMKPWRRLDPFRTQI